MNDGDLYPTRPGPVAVAVDPGTNIAVVANQTDNSVSVLNLGPMQAFSITETSPKTFVTTSTLGSSPSPAPQPLTVIGKGLTCTSGSTSSERSPGRHGDSQLPALAMAIAQLTATVPSSMLTSAHRFALDVADLSGNVTNAEDFTVEQSVDVTALLAAPRSPREWPSIRSKISPRSLCLAATPWLSST